MNLKSYLLLCLSVLKKKTGMMEFGGSIFSGVGTRGLLDGSLRALRNSLLGLMLALVSFPGIPLVGFQKGGLVGLILGGMVGSLLASATVIVSFITSIYQLISGVLSTPASIFATFFGQTWDSTNREYVNYVFEEDARDLETRRSTLKVSSQAFYERLGVSYEASRQEIKKAYRKRARLVHPDKNPDDANAEAEFLQLHEAYQTLSDDKLRAQYDKFGFAPSSNDAFDASVFFAVLLDADSVEPYIGELRVSYYVNKLQEFINQAQLDMDLDFFLEGWNDDSRRRQVEIAKNMLDFLANYENGDMTDEQLSVHCQKQAEKISESTFGKIFLKMIGGTLVLEAQKFLGYSSPLTIPIGVFASSLQYAERIRNKWSSSSKVFRLVKNIVSAGNLTKGWPNDASSVSFDVDMIKSLLPDLLDLAWTFIESDVSWALQGACGRLFADSVGRTRRQRRAKGLRILGKAMLAKEGKSCTDEEISSEVIKRRLERAFALAVKKA